MLSAAYVLDTSIIGDWTSLLGNFLYIRTGFFYSHLRQVKDHKLFPFVFSMSKYVIKCNEQYYIENSLHLSGNDDYKDNYYGWKSSHQYIVEEVVLGDPVEDCNSMPVSNIQYHTLKKFDDGDFDTTYMVIKF